MAPGPGGGRGRAAERGVGAARAGRHTALFGQLAETVHGQGGSAFVLAVHTPDAAVSEEMRARFGADRAREYAEFAARAGGLLAEVGKETGSGKFTFAELEEIEQDLDKLAGWLDKIGARDFFPGQGRPARGGDSATLPGGGGQVRRGGVCGRRRGAIHGTGTLRVLPGARSLMRR